MRGFKARVTLVVTTMDDLIRNLTRLGSTLRLLGWGRAPPARSTWRAASRVHGSMTSPKGLPPGVSSRSGRGALVFSRPNVTLLKDPASAPVHGYPGSIARHSPVPWKGVIQQERFSVTRRDRGGGCSTPSPASPSPGGRFSIDTVPGRASTTVPVGSIVKILFPLPVHGMGQSSRTARQRRFGGRR